MKKTKMRLAEIIEESGIFTLYKDEIIKKSKINSNSIEFELPTGNTDWCNDLFCVLTYMTKSYPVLISGECLKPNTLMLVNTCTMI